MAVKNPFTPIGVPDSWQGKLRVWGIRLANTVMDLNRRLTGLERIHYRIVKEIESGNVATFGVPDSSSHFIVAVNQTSDSRFIGMVWANDSGSVTVFSAHSTNNITTSTATNQFKMTFSGTGTVYLVDTVHYGEHMT